MATYLAPAALGLGDLFVILPVVQSLIASGEQTYLVLRAKEHESLAARIPGLAGWLLEWEVEARLTLADRFIDMRDHPLQRQHWWGSKPFLDDYPGWTINDVLAVICRDKGLSVDFSTLCQLDAKVEPRWRNRIAFIPGSAVIAKCWPTRSWLELKKRLSFDGIDIVVIGQPEHSKVVAELVNSGCDWQQTATVADALDLVSSCAGAVSVDTGIMHLAVHQGLPTVGLFRSSPVYVREFPHFRKITAERACDTACYQRELDCAHHTVEQAGPEFEPNNWQCQAPTRCLDTIEVDRVRAALADLIVGAK